MSKEILVIDTPECCIDCPCHFAEDIVWCGVKDQELETDDIETYKPDWCPLKPMPQQKEREVVEENYNGGYSHGIVHGYNACIDELLSENE